MCLAQAATGQIRSHYYDIQAVTHTEQCSDAFLPLRKINKKKKIPLTCLVFDRLHLSYTKTSAIDVEISCFAEDQLHLRAIEEY